VIFDFEGTLVDFQWRLALAEAELRDALHALGFEGEAFSHGNYAAMWNVAADAWEPDGRLAELRAALGPIYDRWDADALSRWLPRPGAVDLLRNLGAAGTRAGLVSNIGRKALGLALSRLHFTGLMPPIVSRDDVTWLKPRAQGIRRVLEDWQLSPDKVLFVGDSLADVRGARAAGTAVAIISNGECDAAAFVNDPPDHSISNLDEVTGLVAAGPM